MNFKYWSALLITASLAMPALAQKKMSITGQVTNGKVDSFAYINTTSDLIENSQMQYAKVDAQGKFSISLPSTVAVNNIALVEGKQRVDVLATSGSKINLAVDFSNPKALKDLNSKAPTATQINQTYVEQRGGINAFQQKVMGLMNTPYTAFEAELAKVQKEETDYLTQLAASNKTLMDYYTLSIKYIVNNAIVVYPATYISQNQGNAEIQSNGNQIVALAQKAINEFNDAYIYNPFYQEYILNYSLYNIVYAGVENTNENQFKQVDSVFSLLLQMPQTKTSAFGASKVLLLVQKNLPTANWNAKYNQLLQKYPKDPNVAMLTAMKDKLEAFDAGKKAVDFEFVTIEGEKKRLSDYKGKVVYLDFWASWCGPCRQQMPAAKEIKKHFEGQDVVFLYVSIDDKEQAWKQGIINMGVEGIQTRSGGWGGTIPKLYNISSIPAYFLIDKQGNFAPRPPRPSQKQELIQAIDVLLKQK